MNVKDILNADHEALIQWATHGLRWWVAELMEMVPPEWRERFLQRKTVVAEMRGDQLTYRDERSGQVLGVKPRGSIRVLMPHDTVLTREVDLPVLPVGDVKRMLALDIDRLTPFRAENVLFDAEIVSRNPDSGRQTVLLGVVPRESAAGALEQARGLGVEPAALGVMPARGSARSNLDFLPALRDVTGGSAARRRAAYWWAAAAVFFAFNIFFLSYRDSAALDELRSAVESQQTPVTVALRLRNKVEKEATHRRDLIHQQALASPLKVLDAVTRALPNGAWVQRYEWNGKTVHIRGFAKNSPNLLARLESSTVLHNARALTTDPHAGSGNTYVPFDLAADRRVERAR